MKEDATFTSKNTVNQKENIVFLRKESEMKKSLIVLSMGAVLSLVLAACSPAATSPAPVSAGPATPVSTGPAAGAGSSGDAISIEMKNFSFSPQETTIKVGTKITWTNMDSAGHDVKAADGSWGSDTLTQGQSFSHVFDKPGTYAYVCTFHARMTGTIIVTA
jgi:plastocyanin